MFWLLWFSLAVLLISSVAGVFAWNGNLLELVKIKTARNLWLISAVGIAIGLILFLLSGASIVNTPSLAAKFSNIPSSPPFWLWCAILLLILGGFIIGVPTQVHQLKLAKLSREFRSNLFYFGVALITLGVLLLIWLLIPGNQLPS